tara:strand:- start:406 stop:876 length:471 start_codon:yes stop_codon:yes gene_type:complete
MALTTVRNGGLAGSIDLTSKVTGTLPTSNGGTGSTSSTFVNMTSNVTGVLPVANGGTNLSSGFSNGAGTNKGDVGSYTMAFCNDTSEVSGNTGGAGTTAGTNLRVRAIDYNTMEAQSSFSSVYWNFSGTWRNMSSTSLSSSSDGSNMPNGLWVRTV